MPWQEPWPLKIRRRLRKPYNKLVHRNRHFVCRYLGALFVVDPVNIGGLEASAGIAERVELDYFMRACRELRPEVFIDIGANMGLYTCILLRNGLVPRAIAFEPGQRNLIHLRANLLINDLLDRVDIREVALGDAPGRARLIAGPRTDIGLAHLAGSAEPGGEPVEIARGDDVLALSGGTLAMKIDIERHERQALAGLRRTLADNRGIVQIETFREARDDVVAVMADSGYALAQDFWPNLVFVKR